MMLRRLTNQRGNILLFTVVAVVPIMLIFAGLAIDMGYFGDVDAELQRAMDAAALAGAGTLASIVTTSTPRASPPSSTRV
jgi:Flp pilus assembly protein TadG